MSRQILMIAAYFVYFLIGFVSVVFAPALPEMIKHFGLNIAQAGLIFPAKSLGHIAAVLVGGVWSDRVGRKPMIVGGAMLLGFGSLGVAAGKSWLLVLCAFLLSSVGQGFVNSSVNALVADLNPQQRGRALNILHGVYGLGGFTGPLLLIVSRGWRWVFAICGLLWLVCGLFNLALAYPLPASSCDIPSRRRTFITWGGALFASLFAVAFLYNGTAWGLIGWINTYLDEKANLIPYRLATCLISLYYIALTTGRFLWSRVADQLGYGRVILLCALGPVVAYPLVIWANNPWLVACGVVICGLFFAGIYPTALAYATQGLSGRTGTIAGTMSMAMATGSMVVPWVTGIIADRASFALGMVFIYILVLALLAVAILVNRLGADTIHKSAIGR